MKETALYIHIPFCDHKCIYCDFYSIITNDNIAAFLQSLEKEIIFYSNRYARDRLFTSVYFGGGTPSLMEPDYLEQILLLIKKYLSISPEAEITMETNPGTVDKKKLEFFKNVGINRISIGIQSFDETDLKFLTRIHNRETAIRTVLDAKETGYDNISIDLIFNLPGQTKEKWLLNLREAIRLPIQHISAYSLILERGTILNKMVLDGKVKIQDEDHDADLYKTTIDFKTQERGSDLWLFSKTTDVKNNMDKLVVLLSPSENTRTWYDIDSEQYTLSIYSTRPTNVSYRFTGPRFDYAQWSNYNDNPSSTGFVVDNGDLIATGEPEETPVDDLATLELTPTVPGTKPSIFDNLNLPVFELRDAAGNVIEEVSRVSDFVVANIKAGTLEAQRLAVQNLTSLTATVDNLLITNGLVSPTIQTALISPLPDQENVTVQIGNEQSGFGKLIVENTLGEDVASIDTSGNATFSGTLEAEEVKTNDVIAGKIYADEIVARNGYFSEVNSASILGITREEIEEMLRQAETDQDLLAEASAWSIYGATESASLDEIAVNNLYVTEQAAVNTLSASSSITVGGDLVISSSVDPITSLSMNSINTISGPLSIQSLALAPVEIMAGKIRRETNGDIAIEGNVNIAGKLEVGGASTLSELQTNKLTTDRLVIAGADPTEATSSGQIEEGIITTNATLGSAVITAGRTEITIQNPNITDYTLVYVTPTSSTQNKVLYIKSKAAGYFTVGFSDPLEEDVSFNWWVVETNQ